MEMLKFSLLILATVLVANVSSQCPPRDPITNCVIYDSTHIKTFDGKVYSVISQCSVTLVEIPSKALTINYLKNPSVIQIIYNSNKFEISMNAKGAFAFTVNGAPVKIPTNVPMTVSGVTVSQPGSMAIIELLTLGIKIRYNGDLVEVIQDNTGNDRVPSGLCGNNDGCNNNDLVLKDGTPTIAPVAVVNDWALPATPACVSQSFASKCGANVFRTLKANEYCNNRLFSRPEFAACSTFNNEFLTICASNYCGCDTPVTPEECECEMLDSYARACQTKNNNIMNWRSFGLCKKYCDNVDQTYLNCAPDGKQLSCGDEPLANPNSLDCEEGCYCPSGMRWFEGKCLLLSECPCFIDDCERFKPGEIGTHECYDCTCTNGDWVCPDKRCCCKHAHCIGDPHYQTFDGLTYDFMGKCDYYVLRSFFGDVICRHFVRGGNGVFTRNFQSTAPSFCLEVLVIVDGHIITISQKKVTTFDNRLVSNFPYVRDGIRVVERSSQYISVILRNNVEVQFDGIWSLYVTIPDRMINRVRGLFGTFSETTADDLTKPDGTLAATRIEFANSWKVPGSCSNDFNLEVPHPCTNNPAKQLAAEQFCDVLLSSIFDECFDTIDQRQSDYNECVYDGCACEDNLPTCLCGMYELQAKKCAAKKITVNWRPSVPQCVITCPAGQEYQLNVNPCKRTCADIPLNTDCDVTRESLEEGCACPSGQTLNDKNQCIPIAQCPCIYEGVRFPGGFTFVIEDKGLRYDCVNALWVITPATAKDMRDFPSVEQFKDECSVGSSQRYSGCKRVNTLTCYNQHLEEQGDYDNCVAGCECNPGFVLDTALGMCVRPDDCPCMYKGISYPDDSVISNREEKCTCVDGSWDCVAETEHWEICSVWGDVHVRTFDETFFSFQGTCEYVMMQYDFGTSGSFRVSVETGFCASGTCIVAAYIRYRAENGHIDNVVFAPGENYVASSNLQNLIVTDLGPSVMVDVVAFGARIIWGVDGWIHIHAAPNWLTWPFSGLCGLYDNNPTNDLQVTGQTLNGVADFVDYNRLDNTCDASSQLLLADMLMTTNCAYFLNEVFQTCRLLVPYEAYYDTCLINAQRQASVPIAQQTVSYCDSLAAYAQDCANAGAPVNWRTPTICPLQCPTGKEYYTCDTPCARRNCANMGTGCPDKVCAETCNTPQCSNGQVYADATNIACVNPANCPVVRRSFSRNAFSLLLAKA